MPTMSLELFENGMSIVLPPNRHSNNNNLSSTSDTDNESMDVVVAPPLTTTNSTQTRKQQKRKRNRRHTVQTSTSKTNNKRRDTIQLFAFDSDVTANIGENVSTGRPRRTVSYCVLCFVCILNSLRIYHFYSCLFILLSH